MIDIFTLPPNITIHPWSLESINGQTVTLSNSQGLSAAASATFPVQYQAILIPFTVVKPAIIVKILVANGAVVSGNIDVGIYTSEGGVSPILVNLVSMGLTAQSGVSGIQSFDIADTLLGVGSYYMAITMDNTTGTLYRIPPATNYFMEVTGVRGKILASPYSLPATITTFDVPCPLYIPLFALSTRTLV
jgi:hypothetical protein